MLASLEELDLCYVSFMPEATQIDRASVDQQLCAAFTTNTNLKDLTPTRAIVGRFREFENCRERCWHCYRQCFGRPVTLSTLDPIVSTRHRRRTDCDALEKCFGRPVTIMTVTNNTESDSTKQLVHRRKRIMIL